jgi:hypothetical protein
VYFDGANGVLNKFTKYLSTFEFSVFVAVLNFFSKSVSKLSNTLVLHTI